MARKVEKACPTVDFTPTYIALAQTQRLQKFQSMIYFNKKTFTSIG